MEGSGQSSVPVLDNQRVKDVLKFFKDKVEVNAAEDSSSRDHAPPTKTRAQCRGPQGAVFSGKILSFGCSVCKDNCTFSPNDLLKHFRAVHRGALPTYPCDLCDFITNEFAVLQRHRIAHRNTLVRCELCEDEVQYSLLLLTRHYIMCHSVNGQFQCDWCDFSTMDAGTFVQHIHQHKETHWRCPACRHISLNQDAHRLHLSAHSGTFPFTCPVCGFGADKREFLKKHAASVHKEPAERREDGGTSLKMFLRRTGDSPDGPRSSRVNTLPNGRVLKPELCSEHTYHLPDGTAWSKVCPPTEPSPPITSQDGDGSSSSDAGSHANANGVTVLMLKNKISLPANCTTKVMGFKLVDGRKHLVLKVVPAANQEPASSKHSIVEGVCSTAVKDAVDNGECSDSTVPPSPCLTVSPRSESQIQIDRNEIMAVKVKMEEEETSICTPPPTPQRGHVEGPSSPLLPGSSTTKPSWGDCEQSAPPHKTEAEDHLPDLQCATTQSLTSPPRASPPRASPPRAHTAIVCSSHASSLLSTFQADQEMVEGCRAAEQWPGSKTLPQAHREEAAEDRTDATRMEEDRHNGPAPPHHLLPPACSPQSATHSSPNQEVFTFHNYSKETFNTSPNSRRDAGGCPPSPLLHAGGCPPSPLLHAGGCPPSPLLHAGLQLDEQVTTDLQEDHPDSLLQEFNIIKMEEDSIPVSNQESDGSSSLECLVKEHSDVVMSQQTNQEAVAPSWSSSDPLKPSTATLRLLHLPDGKPPVLLTSTHSPLAMPGFKLITSSANPQINVSYVKPGLERWSAPAAVAPALCPAAAGASSSHYLINSPGLKGPVLLSSAPPPPPADRPAQTQSTCYLLQRSVPLAQGPRTSHLRLANTHLSLNSRPVLAMPATAADKTTTLQSGRQAFLLRYISPPKAGLVRNRQEAKVATPCPQTSDGSAGKLIFKIVSPPGGGAAGSSSQPLFLAARPQTHCFLLSSNTANANASDAVKTLIHLQKTSKKDVGGSCSFYSGLNVKFQPCEAERAALAPRPVRPPSQRKRRRKALFDELPAQKVRRASSKETPSLWNPVAKEVERTLRLSPFRSQQQIKCPRRYQPVVVLNHPDAHVPEVADIMKVVRRYQGAVTKVALSQKTVQVLAQLHPPESSSPRGTAATRPRPRLVRSSVRERFLLRMKLRKKSRRKYEVVKTLAGRGQQVFSCWFCGRLFHSQEDWIGHGQRHLMEATRDWNHLLEATRD